MYLNDLAATIRHHVPDDQIPDGDSDDLFLRYAVLLRSKGAEVTPSDVHDAWAAWIALENPDHDALIPYAALDGQTAAQDEPFVTAIRRAALDQRIVASGRAFEDVLFPQGPPRDMDGLQRAFELYKVMVDSSESLVSRRQGVNTFFLTINGALLTSIGLIVQNSTEARLGALGVMVVALAGGLLCLAWRSLINSFGQLNKGKFKVINTIERYFPVSIYAAEWEALVGRR